MRKVLGWVATIAFFALLVVLALADEILPEILKDRLDWVPTWVWWTVVGAMAVFVAVVFLRPSLWRAVRQSRVETRKRRERLANFEID